MELQKLLDESPSSKDPTWEEAQRIVVSQLLIPSPLLNLVRNSWSGVLAPDAFIRMSGFTGLNPSCLLDAAELPNDGSTPRSQDLLRAVQTLGIRFSAVVLAVNVTVRCVLKSKPGSGWKDLLVKLANDMEIGYKLGVRVGDIGLEGGLLLGFSNYAGVGLLSSAKKEEFKTWKRDLAKFGKLGRKKEIEIFGCEPYQVSALTLQHLGFGTDLAFGVALALGGLNPKHISVDPSIMRWRAGLEWLAA